MKLKRLRNRTLGVALGLGLGWYAAGFLPASLSGAGHPEPAGPAPAPSGGHAPAGEAVKGGEAAHPPGPAEKLVPHEEVGWYRPVLAAVGGLFAAAILIGVPVVRYQGRHPVAEADADAHAHDAHDAHGKDAHAAGHGSGHH